jgi:hypothetical protein
VLLGEASHGTHQFYAARAALTAQWIEQKGFNAVAVEADWPDAYRVNRYVQHRSNDPEAASALGDFTRFPRWMWRNRDVVTFVEWLRAYNGTRPFNRRVGFFGLDLYSLYGSIQAVLTYLDEVDPEAARKARYRYGCFEQFEQDPQQYGYATSFGVSEDCENEAIEQLVDLQRHSLHYLQRDGFVSAITSSPNCWPGSSVSTVDLRLHFNAQRIPHAGTGLGERPCRQFDHIAALAVNAPDPPGLHTFIHPDHAVVPIHIKHIDRDRHKHTMDPLTRLDQQPIPFGQTAHPDQTLQAGPTVIRHPSPPDQHDLACQIFHFQHKTPDAA